MKFRRRQASPAFARLEERLLLAAQPVVDIQDQSIQLGNEATIAVTFDNQPDAAPGGDVGYAPYVDLVLPQNGADGTGPGNVPENDGVSFVSATYLGAAVDATVIEFDAAGEAVHPFARDASGNPVVVRASDFGAAPGDQLVVMRLPFGSFVADQPPASIAVTVQLSPLADIDQPLTYGAVGGFAYGLDPLNNPLADPPIRGTTETAVITPTLFTVAKTFSGPEGETATGPNFPRTYTITFDLAAGQTVTNGILRDVLPDGIVVTGPPVLSGAPGTAVYDPATHTVTATLAGAVTGVAGAEATLTIPFYVGQFLAPGQPATPVLDPVTGAFRAISNDVSAQADWIPLDPRDPTRTVVFDPPGPENVFTAKSIATQKSQSILIDANVPGLGPGDTLQYVIDTQVSDYFSLTNLTVTDVLSDGQTFVAGSARLEVTEAGGTLGTGAFLPVNFTVSRDAGTGLTTLTFDVSDQMVANGAPDGVLTGSPTLGPATYRIVFQTVVDRFFVANGDSVGQGDSISNSVDVDGDVIGPGGVVTPGPGDDSASSGAIVTGSISKEVYALNGTLIAPGTPVSISSGDAVTFRLTYDLPQTLAVRLDLRDFLPLPVFDVAGLSLTLLDIVSPDPPAPNTAKWGPLAAGFDALLTTVPIVTIDLPSNSLTFSFTNLAPAVPVATTADVLFTLVVGDRPFGDGLLLTNQVQATETSSTGSTTDSTAIRQITLNEPSLQITKGVVAFEGSPGVLTPTPPGPVTFTAPGSAGVRFSGEINSTNLALLPIDSDLSNMDAGDVVTFAVVVENVGRGRNGAFDITLQDSLPQGFAIGPGGLNLQVTDGAGNPLAFTGSLFPGGGTLTLTDPGPTTGALAPFAPTGGANIVVITYDLVITNTPQPRSQITNLADIQNYAGVEGGIDRVPNTPGPVEDTATVTLGDPSVVKTLVSTSVAQTSGSDLTIGETVTFDLVATLREGRIRDLVLSDVLPSAPGRLDFVSASLVSIGANLFERDALGNPVAPLGAPVITTSGQTVTFTFADDVVNLPDNVVGANDRIVVRVTAVAADVPGNLAGTPLQNLGALSFTASGNTVTLTDTEDAGIVAPLPLFGKDADRTTVQGNDVVTYTVFLTLDTGPGAGPGFDITLSDPLLPGGLTLIPGSGTLVNSPAGGATLSEAGGVITVTAPVMLPGETLRFTYQARVEPSVVAGTTLPNTVAIAGDSYPGIPPTGVERPFTGTATESVRVPGAGIVKTVTAADTSLIETGTDRFDPTLVDLAIGEIVTYHLTVTLPEAVTTSLRVSDFLPGALAAPLVNQGLFEFLSAAVVRIGASLSGPGLGTAVGIGSDASGDGIADTVTFDFATVVNTPDGILDAGDEIELTVTARVRDAAANVAGRAPVNTAEVSFGGTTQRATATVEIVEPDLAIDKTASRSTGDAGDRVTFTIGLPVQGPNAGPAYDVTVTDTVPVGFDIDLATLGFAVAIPGASIGYDPGTRLITATIPVYQFSSPLAQIRYDAIVAQGVRPAEVLTNTAVLTYDSHPGTPAAEYQRDYGPTQDSTSFTVDLPTLSKRVSSTDIPSTGFRPGQALQDVAIGETVTYLLTLRVPEVTTTLVLTDFLPSSIGAPPGAGDLRLIDAELVSIGANITGASLPPIGDPGLQTDRNASGFLNTVAWNFGTVTNLADNVQDADDLIIVQVTARVINVPANQPGDTLVNTGQTQYGLAGGGTGLVTQTETVQIVGPELQVTKSPSPVSGDAGDVITYTLSVSHLSPPSNSDAYAVVLEDLLDPRLALIVGSVTVTLPGATVLEGNTAGDTEVRIGIDDYAVTPATPFTVTYQARLTDAVRGGTSIPNVVNLTWQSAPAGFPDARPDSASAIASVAVVLPGSITKQVTNTSLPETPETGVPDVEPGETIDYTITLTLGEGTQRVLLQDTLPVGLGFVSGEVVSIGANISGALLGVGAAPAVAGQALTFDFGNAVVNAGDNVLDARDTIVVRVTARTLDIPSNQPGTALTNDARFTNDTGTLTATAPVEVVGPRPVITKDGSIASGDAGDLVTFTVVVAQQPGATGPLYDLNVSDLLPAGYVLVVGSAAASRGAVAESGNQVTLSLPGAALLVADDPGTAFDDTRVTLTYQARLADGVQPGQVIDNTAAFTGSTAPAGTPEARPFAGNDSATVTVVMPVTLDKAIVATSVPGTPGSSVTVGETITYRLTATLSEGTQTLRIGDTLPAGLDVLSASVASIGAGITAGAPTITIAGQVVTADFGTVVNTGNNLAGDGSVVLEIQARVRDVPGNVNGTSLTNAGTVTITAPSDPGRPGGTQTDGDTTTATVVAPQLVLDKSIPPGFLVPGETATFTLTLTHTALSTAPAFDIGIADLLADPNLSLVVGSVTTSRGSVVTGNTAGDATIAITVPELDLGQSVTVTYQALVRAATPPGSTLTNTATASYDSNPGPGGRPDTTQDTATAPVVPGFAKEIAATGNPDTGSGQFDPTRPDLAPGETVTYRLTITLPQGTTNALVLSDLLPAAITPLAARVVSVGAGLTAGAPVIGIAGQAVTLDFGTVFNGSSALIGPEDRIVVEVDARVVDAPGLAAGTALVNAAALGFTIDGRSGTLDAVAPADLVLPGLVIGKQVDRTTGDAGDSFTYTVTIAQAPGATAPAYDISVTDALDPRLILVSASTTAGTTSVAGNTLTLSILRLLLTDPPVTLTYTVRMANSVEPGQVIGNTATLAFDSNPGPGGQTGGGTASAQDLTVVLGVDLGKSIVATSLTGTTSGAITPGVTDLAIGEVVTYELVVRLSEGTQRLVVTDGMPASFLPLPGGAIVVSTGSSISAGAGGTLTPTAVITGQSVSFDFGTIVNTGDNVANAGDLVTLRIDARVQDLPINTGGRIADNAATATISSPSDPGAPGGTVTDGASVPAAVVEPALALDKAVDRTTGDAGDVFTYTLTLTTLPGATGPAYNVTIEDPLPALLAVVPGSLSASFGTATIIGNAIRVTIAELPAGAGPVTVTYRAAFTDAIEPGQVVPNLATLGYASAPTLGRSYTDDATASVRGVFDLDLAKTIFSTSLPETTSGQILPGVTDLAIGEVVTYQLVARLSEGTQSLVVEDVLPDGLLALPGGAVVVTVGGSISAGAGGTLAPVASITGQTVRFDFGTLVNAGDNLQNAGDLVTISIAARVLDVPINVQSRIVENDATATAASPSDPGAPGGTLTAADSAIAALVSPRFLIDKQVDLPSGDAGDVFTYTVTLAPAPGNTGPAYNLLLEDPLPDVLLAIPGSITTTLGTATLVGNTIRIDIPVLDAAAPPVVITYRAAFTDAIEPGQIVPNTVSLQFASAPTAGRGFGGADSAEVVGVFTLDLDKQVVDTSLPETGSGFFDPTLADIAAGETVTYRLTATLAEGTQRLVITDTLPAGLVAESARLVGVGAGIVAGAPVITLAADRVGFDFGTVVNRGGVAGGDTVTVEVTARLSAGPAAGTVLPNTATATISAPTAPGQPGGTLTASDGAAVEAVAAALAFDKQVSLTTVGLGEVVTYTLVLTHAPGSTAPAYGVVVSDPLSDPALSLVSGSVLASVGTVTEGNGGGDTAVTVTLPVLLPGERLTISFAVRTVGFPVPDGIAPNVATFASDSAPGPLPPGFNRPLGGSDDAAVQIVAGAAVAGAGATFPDRGRDAFLRLDTPFLQQPVLIAGTAQPGATVTLSLTGALGQPLSLSSVLTDVGGNWLVQLPEPPFPRFDSFAFAELRGAVGRLPDPGLGFDPPAGPAAAGLGTGTYTFQAGISVSAADPTGFLREAATSTFAGAVSPGGFFTPGSGAFGSAAVQAGLARAADPFDVGGSLALNAFGRDFLAAQAAAGALGR